MKERGRKKRKREREKKKEERGTKREGENGRGIEKKRDKEEEKEREKERESERVKERMKKIAVRINGAWIPLLVFMDVSLILLFLLSTCQSYKTQHPVKLQKKLLFCNKLDCLMI